MSAEREEREVSAIREAYDLIKDEARWCANDDAQDADGNEVAPWSSAAVRWCARGAVTKCATVGLPWLVGDLHIAAERLFPGAAIGGAPMCAVNDDLGHAAVLQVFEKVLAERGELL